MALSIKIDPVERFTEAIVRNDLSLPEQRREIVAFVSAGIVEGDQTNAHIMGRIPPRTITVDGRHGASLDTVNPDGGSIIVEWDLFTEALIWIGAELEARSPVVSGHYKRGHTLFADGVEIKRGQQIPQATEYVFVNLVPYARKIEVGKTASGRNFVIQVPNMIYQNVARDARARFGNSAKISFSYQSVNGAAIGAWAKSASAGRLASRIRKGNPKLHHEWLTRQPAIFVTFPK